MLKANERVHGIAVFSFGCLLCPTTKNRKKLAFLPVFLFYTVLVRVNCTRRVLIHIPNFTVYEGYVVVRILID